ncbi:MAG: DoxX family membrane protein [Alphaproteobacteria bacterium]|nr:DoxX family membrane protein [Alphaproteobacteria bacterium]
MTKPQAQDYGATVLRASLGTMFLAHAGLKIFVFTLPGTVGYFESLGLPGVFAHATILAELVGGFALIAGIYTRAVSLALIPLLAGTITFVHGANGWAFTNEGGGWEYPAFLIAALFAQALIGDGTFALNTTIRRLRNPQA